MDLFFRVYGGHFFDKRTNGSQKKKTNPRKELNLSIEEVRAMADIGKYDLVNWDWKNAFISPRKLYLLEDTLEKMYLIKFGKEFEMK